MRDSVADAKAYNAAQRQIVEDLTGLRITDAGAHQAQPARIVVVPCVVSGCLYVAAGASEDKALAKIEAHLVRKHFPQDAA